MQLSHLPAASALFASPRQASAMPPRPTPNFISAPRRVTDWARLLVSSSNWLFIFFLSSAGDPIPGSRLFKFCFSIGSYPLQQENQRNLTRKKSAASSFLSLVDTQHVSLPCPGCLAGGRGSEQRRSLNLGLAARGAPGFCCSAA